MSFKIKFKLPKRAFAIKLVKYITMAKSKK